MSPALPACPAPSFALSSHGETVVALAPRLAGGAERLAPLPMMLHAVATVACCYALSGVMGGGGCTRRFNFNQKRPFRLLESFASSTMSNCS